jgi:hypothetical protein
LLLVSETALGLSFVWGTACKALRSSYCINAYIVGRLQGFRRCGAGWPDGVILWCVYYTVTVAPSPVLVRCVGFSPFISQSFNEILCHLHKLNTRLCWRAVTNRVHVGERASPRLVASLAPLHRRLPVSRPSRRLAILLDSWASSWWCRLLLGGDGRRLCRGCL